ncbi:hypothetical protein HOG27_06785 [bacterium]|nr:hypothetical protein [bacterium]
MLTFVNESSSSKISCLYGSILDIILHFKAFFTIYSYILLIIFCVSFFVLPGIKIQISSHHSEIFEAG